MPPWWKKPHLCIRTESHQGGRKSAGGVYQFHRLKEERGMGYRSVHVQNFLSVKKHYFQ